MAPPRNRTRRSSIFTWNNVNVEEQLAEMRRYEQEKKDLAYARRLQAENDQQNRPNQPPAVVAPDSPELIQNVTVTIHARGQINVDSSRGQLIRGPRRTINRNHSSSDSSDEDEVVGPPRHRAHANGDLITFSDSSDLSDSDLSGPSENIPHSSSDNRSSSDSDNNAQQRMTPPVSNASRPPVRRVGLPTIRIERVSQPVRRPSVVQNIFRDNSNQPSTSGSVPKTPVRAGVPVGTWGDCTMCFEVPIRPQGCNRCQQILGCATCVGNWFNTAQPHASCPLCRNKWRRKADVSAMSDIARKKHRPIVPGRRRTRAAQ